MFKLKFDQTFHMRSIWYSSWFIYIHRIYNGSIVRNFFEHYVAKIFYKILLCLNRFILQLQPALNVSSFEWLYEQFFYCVYNQVNTMNISNICVSVFKYSSYFHTWWFILEFYLTLNVRIYLWKDDLSMYRVYNE